MAKKFQEKYPIPSARASWWNYTNDGNYFVIINTNNKNHWFGQIEKGKMELSEVGRIVEQEWLKTIEMRPDMNLDISCFVVMPNHFHAIVCIGENEYNKHKTVGIPVETHCCASVEKTHTDSRVSETHSSASLKNTYTANKFGSQSHNLASIIRGFKSGVTKNARKSNPNFAWQARYHDHIIRSSEEFIRISHYIYTNVENWEQDVFFQ
jgi:REP element-mobilizing transposase RayT